MTRFEELPSPSTCAIGTAKITPSRSPSVADPIVNQNDVRTTVSFCGSVFASK